MVRVEYCVLLFLEFFLGAFSVGLVLSIIFAYSDEVWRRGYLPEGKKNFKLVLSWELK